MAEKQTSPPWSDLPPELLGMVFLRLVMRTDRAFFCAVCRHWSSAAQQCRLPPPSPVSWLVLPAGSVVSLLNGDTFHLPEGTRYNSFGEWILLSRDDSNCFLMNPFTKATMPLPSLTSYSHYEEPVQVSDDCKVPDHGLGGTWMYNMDSDEISVLTLVVCSPRLIAAIVASIGYCGTIALYRPGVAAWSVSAHEDYRWLSQMVFFQGKLYAIENEEDILAFDIVDEHNNDEPRVPRIQRIIKGEPLPSECNFKRMAYLLESHGTLLMIHRYMSYKVEIVRWSERRGVSEADFEWGGGTLCSRKQ